MSIGENIQFYRKKCGYSQKELAAKLHYSTGTIQQYELDKREPKFKIICEIATALGVKPYKLYEYEQDTTEFKFSKACDWLKDAGFNIESPNEDDGLQRYEINDFDNGTICKMDKIDIIDLVGECRKQAEADTDEQTIKYIKMALMKK